MSVAGIDHVAITVADVEATCAFYARVLDAEVLFLDRYLEGEIPIAMLALGGCRLSVHPAAAPATPHAAAPTPGSGDLCFRWSASIDDAVATLRAAGVAVEVGPVPRPAANGDRGQSVYFRDLDDNLIELLTTVVG